MDVDWLADVRKYVPDADEGVVGKIVKYCGIALRTPNAASVTFSDPTETERVRENYLKKKLSLTQDDATLDGAIASVGARMGTEDGYRVTVYYLLAEHFDLLDTFGGAKTGGAAVAPVAAAAATATAAPASTTSTPAETPVAAAMSPPTTHSPTRPTGGGGAGTAAGGGGGGDDGDDMFGIGCVAGLIALGAIILAALIAVWAQSTILAPDPEEETAASAPAPAPEPEPTATPEPAPEVPEGAGVTATERDGKPLLTVYFDTGASEVAPNFEEVSGAIRTYLEENPDATVAISGFNDPTGNAEINAALSRDRAQNVQAALVALGVAEERTDLVRPDDTTSEEMSNAEARRVEISIVE